MNLYLVRHGQTHGNLDNKYIGSFEAELSLKGVKEIERAKELIKDVNFKKVFSSERKRAIDSAKILSKKEIIYDYRLNEMNFGIFENMTYEEICSKYPEEEKAWRENWINYKIPKGESVREVYNRVLQFVKIFEKEEDENYLFVTHGGIIKLIYCYILGGDLNLFWKFVCKNGSISIVKFQYGNWYIDSIIQLESKGGEINE